MMSDINKKRRKIVNIIIDRCNDDISFIEMQNETPISSDDVTKIMDEAIEYYRKKKFVVEESEKNKIQFEIQQRLVKVAEKNKPTTLQGKRVKRWLSSNPQSWKLWGDYEELLLRQKRSQDVIWKNEEVIDNCIDMSGDPSRKGPWESRGLVMGNVQSGKTLNFIGLINKAMDAGYHTIIVIGGHLKELREQSQERVDEGVIGRNSRNFGIERGNVINVNHEPFGVAKSDSGLTGRPHGGTTVHSDFSAAQARALNLNFASTEPVIFVVKKNYKLLNNLRGWIGDFPDKKVLDRPMLLIDDEADYASINTKKAGEKAAATNVAIKQLLKTFTRKTYIGYTATPFANVFIPQYFGCKDKFDDDLFPRDFMATIPIPDDYCGQDYFFPENSDDEKKSPVRKIAEKEYEKWLKLKHKKDAVITGIPDSLRDAILCFLLVIAIRYRGGNETAHNTMLVNVSRFNDVQWGVTEEIGNYLTIIKNAVKANGALDLNGILKHQVLNDLYQVYENEYEDCGFCFSDLMETLNIVCEKTKVSLVNGLFKKFSQDKKSSPLPYSDNEEEGLWVIAVGGLKLSRGLTLEGLSISYFLRNAAAYDTLTQMCRWYGYRPGYKELCRLWITDDSKEHYHTVANAIRQLYEDLKLMKVSDGTPNDFGLRVRASDLSLLITARNKMRTAEKVTMTYNLWGNSFKKIRASADKIKNIKNHNVIGNVVSRLLKNNKEATFENNNKPYVIQNVDYEDIIEIVRDTDFPIINPRHDPNPVIRALKAMEGKDLIKPKILIYNQGASDHIKHKYLSPKELEVASKVFPFEGLDVGLANRSMTYRNGDIYSNNAQIGNKDDLSVLFEPHELDALYEKAGVDRKGVSETFYQSEITSPVMIVYIIAALITDKKDDGEKTVSLGHGDVPTILYTLFFPAKKTVENYSNEESVDIPDMEKEESYFTNEVLRGARIVDVEDIGDEDDALEDEEGSVV